MFKNRQIWIISLFYSFFLLLSLNILADEISNFQIEGISVGDSLLDHVSEKEILTQINDNKYMYNYLNEDFGEVYLFDNLIIYDRVSFFVKPKDKNYIIYSIKGSISYDDQLSECFIKQKEIEKEISSKYTKTEKITEELEFSFDPSGESITYNTYFIFESLDHFRVACTKYKKELKNKHNWEDSLQVLITTKEVAEWFNNPL